uniref:Oxidoreductase N-terminal domain-containing protein n=1 Tax=Mycena chlorophos TaxID=658473 RepID=A0ABQ0LX97_MYCCL|nr:predicted protein [Mycena chlorophos]
MSPIPNPRVLYAKVPGPGPLVAGEHLVYDSAPTIDLDGPLRGGFLTKTLLLSPEPFMRERLRDPSVLTYSTPMVVGQPLVGFGLVQVLRSEKDGVKAGDYMYGFTPWERYTVQPYVDARFDFASANYPSYTFDMDSLVLQPVPDPLGAFPWSRFASVLGTPGLTAFVGLESVAPDMKAGQTIYVSSGASGVGRCAPSRPASAARAHASQYGGPALQDERTPRHCVCELRQQGRLQESSIVKNWDLTDQNTASSTFLFRKRQHCHGADSEVRTGLVDVVNSASPGRDRRSKRFFVLCCSRRRILTSNCALPLTDWKAPNSPICACARRPFRDDQLFNACCAILGGGLDVVVGRRSVVSLDTVQQHALDDPGADRIDRTRHVVPIPALEHHSLPHSDLPQSPFITVLFSWA